MQTTLPEPWLSLRRKYRTIKVMARMIGVSPRTLYHWLHGTRTPGASGKRLLDLFLEAHGLPPFSLEDANANRSKD
jgi:DNA-binding transcriptional regulator YiaG